MRPYDAKNNDDVCTLRRDNIDAGEFWMLIDGREVTIARQKVGEDASQIISVPRAEFNRLIAWYMRDQKTAA